MDIKIENGKIIFSENNIKYSFDAHGEYPRPSIMPAISVGGKHLSNRSEDIKIEKHTAVQDIAIGNNMAAWYTQEFLPDGADYKLSKKASIYIGDFSTGKEKLIYKGECYGDLCFYENDLFFNIGNKVAVYHLNSGESEVLFKHSGIKKSGIDLHITPKRIFFQHWTHSNNNTMWYDRETQKLINPHFDGSVMFFLDDETIIYKGLNHTWIYDTKLKDNAIFTETARKFIGELTYQQKKYVAYYISKDKENVYIKQVINDIQKTIEYNNVIVFMENINILNKSNRYFIFGKASTLIINVNKTNLERMRYIQKADLYEVLKQIYENKEILLSNWKKADYMTEDKQYIFLIPFIDTEKLHKLNIFYNNKISNRKIDILTLKENKRKIEEILSNNTNIIELDNWLGGI